MNRNWILIGMMGAGKTSLGKEISFVTGRQHLDTDLLLQQRLGRPIPQLFKIYGEAAFRDHETSILKGIQSREAVISTGGGVVLREANWEEMKRLGPTIYVEVSLSHLAERLATSKKKRPLLQVENWEDRLQSLLELRTPYYQKADITVNITGLDVPSAAEKIMAELERP